MCIIIKSIVDWRIGDEEVVGITGKYGVPEINWSGEKMGLCFETDVFEILSLLPQFETIQFRNINENVKRFAIVLVERVDDCEYNV